MPSSDQPHRSKGRFHHARAAHRARAHESAHAEDNNGEAEKAPRPSHPLVPGGPAAVITTDEQLDELIAHLRSAGSFAYDSEFIGEMTYFPRLCLIQAATAQRVALVDPLAGVELRPFWELLADASVEKVVHAGQQDVEPVWRHIGREARNVFDTQIAAGFVALPYPLSLSKLVGELTGAKLGKGLTFSHWDQRPLSSMQLRYAADDVRYLPLAREELRKRLDATGRAGWAAEECAAMTDPVLYRFDPDSSYLRVRGATSLHAKNLGVLRELTIWRNAAARAEDVPPRTFLRDEILIDLSRQPVKAVEKLDRVRAGCRGAGGEGARRSDRRGDAAGAGGAAAQSPLRPRRRADAARALPLRRLLGGGADDLRGPVGGHDRRRQPAGGRGVLPHFGGGRGRVGVQVDEGLAAGGAGGGAGGVVQGIEAVPGGVGGRQLDDFRRRAWFVS